MAAKQRNMMRIKLLIHKESSKVVFAECGKDFIDVLFSFFTLPIGTIIRLTNKNSNLGCMDTLYTSVEALDNGYFETQACKAMLLNPKTASEFLCQKLVVNLDGVVPNVYYLCPNWVCCTEIKRLASVFENVKCGCGREMSKATDFVGEENDGVVFVKGVDKFVVFDDLRVIMVPRETSLGLDHMFGPEERLGFEERIVAVGLKEVLQLLTCSLASTRPMTNVFMLNKNDALEGFQSGTHDIEIPSPSVQPISKRIRVKLWVRKSTNKVIFAEVKEDFLDLLFGFLAFPLGYAVKFLGPHSNLGTLHKLYKSMEVLCTEYPEDFTENMDHLLDPQIAHHFGCQNQLINIKEASWETKHLKCFICFNRKLNYCCHWLGHTDIHLINPKIPCTDTSQGGGFLRNAHVFMVSDDLLVKPFSWISWISVIHKMGVPYSDVEERIADVGEQEVFCVFRSSLTSSETALSDAFCNGN